MAKRLFLNTFLVTLAAILAASALIMGVLYRAFDSRFAKEIANAGEVVSKALNGEKDGLAYLSGLGLEGIRITWIASDGTVLYDNAAVASQMENHADRPEVVQAKQIGIGKNVRFSATRAEKTQYYALLMKDGSVLRTAATQHSVWGLVLEMIPAFVLIVVAVLLLSAILARLLVRRTLRPLNELDLENPAANDVYDELSPLLFRLEQQNRYIARQMEELNNQQEKLNAITDNMLEGLVTLDAKQHILFVNRSALRLFGVTKEMCLGKNVFSLSRNASFGRVIQKAACGEGAESTMEIGARVYQILASPVRIGGDQAGTVLLLLDISDKADAERMRREFSANVSHELKTPLTSILGYAEIMKNGVAKPEDMVKFAGRIYEESNRLIKLLSDIIKLSRLDEGSIDLEKEDVDLLELAKGVSARLKPLADQNKITISVDGESRIVYGVRAVLDEMIHNLCENGIKYGKTGGNVNILIGQENGETTVLVEDDGIGIPLAHQDKVFERFYRVDKSHSHIIGGTGLGLSIVKHGAKLHGARVFLTSTDNVGTKIKLVFPPDVN